MDIMQMKKSDFKEVPLLRWGVNEDNIVFDSVVIIPTARKHSSGYMCMKYILCNSDEPIGALDYSSDVLHLDGIGGYGDWLKDGDIIPDKIEPKGWHIDCIPCGYLRLFARNKLSLGSCLNDTEIYAKPFKR